MHLWVRILKDGPELPKVPGAHAEEGGEVLEGMYTEGCKSPEESKIRGGSGITGAKFRYQKSG
jgi:hypothetical protein